jgi:two-component sensor histidine kinase
MHASHRLLLSPSGAPVRVVRTALSALRALAVAWREGLAKARRDLLAALARSVPDKNPSLWQSQQIALANLALALALRAVLTPFLNDSIPLALFCPFILAASIWGGSAAGFTTLVALDILAPSLWLGPELRLMAITGFTVGSLSIIVLARLLRIVVRHHAQEEERAVLLAHEMKHRVGNLFGVVQAISAETARHAASLSHYQAQFSARLMALARAQQLAAEAPGELPDLKTFLFQIVGPFGADRFVLDGPDVALPRYLGTSCALLLHELCTNAAKYGALSGAEGGVLLTWRIQEKRVVLDWREQGGPKVTPPLRSGFGSRLVETAFPAAFGKADMRFPPDGVECTVNFALL